MLPLGHGLEQWLGLAAIAGLAFGQMQANRQPRPSTVTGICKGKPMCRVVAYYRVSTEGQGRSGLGLEAQREAVASLCRSRGWSIAAEFTEVESGKRADRPQLKAAMHRAKVTGGTLVVAKLDRLSRSVAFLSALQDSGGRFLAADMPEANELTVHIMAAVAQAERKAISRRTMEALAAAKARGGEAGQSERRCGPAQGGEGELGGCGGGEGGCGRAGGRLGPGGRGHSGERRNIASCHRAGVERAGHCDAARGQVARQFRAEPAGEACGLDLQRVGEASHLLPHFG